MILLEFDQHFDSLLVVESISSTIVTIVLKEVQDIAIDELKISSNIRGEIYYSGCHICASCCRTASRSSYGTFSTSLQHAFKYLTYIDSRHCIRKPIVFGL